MDESISKSTSSQSRRPRRRGCCLSMVSIMDQFGWLMQVDESRPLEHFANLGWDVDLYLPWEHYKTIDFAPYEFIMVRTTWNFTDDFAGFLRALRFIRSKYPNIPFFNDVDVIEWNGDKLYMSDLARLGVPTIPTVYVSRGQVVATPLPSGKVKPQAEHVLDGAVTPSSLLEKIFLSQDGCFSDIHQLVIKPTVSNDSDYTFRFTKDKLNATKSVEVSTEKVKGVDVHGAFEGSSKDGNLAAIESTVTSFKELLDAVFKGDFEEKAQQNVVDRGEDVGLVGGSSTVRNGYMVQPFIESVLEEGEYSIFLFGDTISHAIRKRPKSGDFRVQESFGGSVELLPAAFVEDPGVMDTINAVTSAIKSLFRKGTGVVDEGAVCARYNVKAVVDGSCVGMSTSQAPSSWPLIMFARIDLMRFEGRFVVVECELIEPALYLHADDGQSARRFAEHVTRVVGAPMNRMEPNLLMRTWMMAHVYGAKYQAAACCAGSSGEAAFRESLEPSYTSARHDAKGLRTFHITGTRGGDSVSRIASGCIGHHVVGGPKGALRITVTSNTSSWEEGDLNFNPNLHGLTLKVERLTHIPTFFLHDCPHLEHLDLAPLHAIRKIPSGFLSGCSGLREVDLTPLVNVDEVGSMFLKGCRGLTRINLASLNRVDGLQNNFLAGCSALTEVDLTPLVNVAKINKNFLMGCAALTRINMCAAETVGERFLSGCSKLEVVDLKALFNRVTVVGDFFMENCTALTSLDLTPLVKVDEIAKGFLRGCSALQEVDLQPLVNVRDIIEYEFLDGCTSLHSLKYSKGQLPLIPVNLVVNGKKAVSTPQASVSSVKHL